MFDLITAFAIFALVIGGRAILSSQRSVGFTRGQKIASFFSLILYLCGASLLVWALLWRGIVIQLFSPYLARRLILWQVSYA